MEKYQNILTGKKVLIMGLGRIGGGLGSTIFAIKSGAAEIIITDSKDEEFNKPSINKINSFLQENKSEITNPHFIKYVLGEHHNEDFLWADVIIKNPAVKFQNPYIQLAQSHGKIIETEMTLFLAQKNPKATIIGITGSKGKSSSTFLIYHILQLASERNVIPRKIAFGGNMGVSMLEPIDVNFDGIYVIELSSFVTEAIYVAKLKIDYLVITSLFPDHLNYYDSPDEYYHSKVDLIQNLDAQNVYINSSNLELAKYTDKYPVNKIDVTSNQVLVFPEFFNEPLKQNATLVAYFLHEKFDINYDLINNAFETYKLVEGRFEYLGKAKNVDFINDTCASIPEAAVMGLTTLVKQKKKIFLITGGSDKGLTFDKMFEFENTNCEKIYLIKGGNTFDIFEQNLDKNKTIVCDNLTEAEHMAFKDAQKVENSTVILCRGCTSFGVANNEFEMGKLFEANFEGLKN